MKSIRIAAKAILYLVIYAAIVMLVNQAMYNWISDPKLHDWIVNNSGIVLIVSNIIVLAIYIPLLRLQKITLKELGFVRPRSGSLWLSAGTGIWLGLFIATFTRLPWIKVNFPAIADLVAFVAGGRFIIFLLGSLLLGSLLEEWLFRGMMFHTLRQRLSVAWTILLQAVLFGAVFMNVTIGAFAALGAIVYGIVRAGSNSLWASLAAHILSTGSLYLLLKWSVDWQSGTLGLLALISGLGIAVHAGLLLRQPNRSKGKGQTVSGTITS
ncbi:CPBP family intramembrane metalloprotease [Paenibacillus sp. 1011MAR3C5]|uniref:CPBP family intramembrane glutamic endopeptidase n=1 Tax=Paenibacillus sp. 1011MAR3C5 TaxID=1675787 RepID=UPI000E6BCDE8|nr:CPBP family intramembrane glutamic endopeptidase [Paenibacillus sp. 1011MAR3C5]RJE90833.1 CPBP family intramembrane metalloprotease [Paenibacillus sp. 1011MAR3C5]